MNWNFTKLCRPGKFNCNKTCYPQPCTLFSYVSEDTVFIYNCSQYMDVYEYVKIYNTPTLNMKSHPERKLGKQTSINKQSKKNTRSMRSLSWKKMESAKLYISMLCQKYLPKLHQGTNIKILDVEVLYSLLWYISTQRKSVITFLMLQK